jgi:hypothetical protein
MAIQLIKRGIEIFDPSMPYISTHFYSMECMDANPEFERLLEQMNLTRSARNVAR